jgi:hypothetical protein
MIKWNNFTQNEKYYQEDLTNPPTKLSHLTVDEYELKSQNSTAGWIVLLLLFLRRYFIY